MVLLLDSAGGLQRSPDVLYIAPNRASSYARSIVPISVTLPRSVTLWNRCGEAGDGANSAP